MQEIKSYLERLRAAEAALQESTKSFSLTAVPSKEDQEKTIKLGKVYEAVKLEGQALLMKVLTRTVVSYADELGVKDSFLRAIRSGKKKISPKLMERISDDNQMIRSLIEAVK